MASRMDWIMSFIRCATLIAPSTLKAVEASCAAASRGAGRRDGAGSAATAGFWAAFMSGRSGV